MGGPGGTAARHVHNGLDLLFVVDPVSSLNAAHDTSVALMESAAARGHRILVTTMPELEIRDGRGVAPCVPLQITPAELRDGHWHAVPDWYSVGQVRQYPLDEADAIFVRTDPPVDAGYLRATYILDAAAARGTLVINSPRGLRDANEKLFALRWPELCPDTAVLADITSITALVEQWGTAVIKPIDGMAGRGILLLRHDDANLSSIVEISTDRGRRQVVVQRFVDRASEGDRRIIVLDGEPIGALRRVASGREFRCNMAAGATVAADTVTPRDKEICRRMAPAFAECGLSFVGIDVIGDCLTEINVTSPTGVREIDAFAGTRLSDEVLTWVEDQVERR